VKDASHTEMEKLGIVVDGLQIQEIEDPTGYIKNLAAPHAAAVASTARIAAAERDQEAAEKEQQAARAKAQFARETAIAQAKIQAEVQQAEAEAAQAGPLAEAKATQAVIGEQTELAEREAALTGKRLESGVADAQRVEAAGAADAARAKADADAYAARVVADADAEAINARANALLGEHQTLIAANKLVDMLPELVQASARGIEGSKLTILGGSQGVNEFTTGLATQGLSIYTALQSVLAANGNGPGEKDSGDTQSTELH
jgi:uncharacterized membrane protein YqiK